jgi:mRNA-degrading endonuclease YafQ of YafQ-DinJ toxin-antitoxin module
MEFLFSARFKKSYKELSTDLKKIVLVKLKLLSENRSHPSLRTKKIKGRSYIFECSVNMSIRITWQYKDNKILLRAMGEHDSTLSNP